MKYRRPKWALFVALLIAVTCIVYFSHWGNDPPDEKPPKPPELTDITVSILDTNYALGSEVGKITFPALEIDWQPIFYGSDSPYLDLGICLTEREGGWEFIGENGRSLLSCHNYAEFRHLNSVEIGERILLETGGYEFEYEVIDSRICTPENWDQFAYYETPENGITLSTCYPFVKGTSDRWILNCKLISISELTIQ